MSEKIYECLNCGALVKEDEIVVKTNARFADALEPMGIFYEDYEYCPYCRCEFDFFMEECDD